MTEKEFEVTRVEIAKLELQKGDVLVLKFNEVLTDDEFERIKKRLHHWIGSEIKLLVLDSRTEISVVHNDDV